MDISATGVAKEFSELIKQRNPKVTEATSNEKEKFIAKEMLQWLDNTIIDCIVEDDEILEENACSETSSFSQQLVVDDDGKEVKENYWEGCTIKRKIEILKLVEKHPTWKVSSFWKNGAPEFRYMHYKTRWETQIKRGGTRFEQWKHVDEFTHKKFQEAREELKIVKGSNLRLWALQAAQSFRDPSFKFSAGPTWINNFKLKHGISSRKITKLVSRKELVNMETVLEAAKNFQLEIKSLAPSFKPHLVLNTDQAGFVYELFDGRTLSVTGEKITAALMKSPTNLCTHSYTVMYTISMEGKIVGDIFLCFQEKTGKMGEQVKKTLFTAPNVTVSCSSSGKLTTSIYEYYLDNVLLKSVTEKFLFIVDSWAGQTNENSYTSRFGVDGSPECVLKIIPKNCTGFCQPLDTTFHRQLKYFVRKMYAEAKMNFNVDVNPTDEITTRNSITRVHSLVGNQLAAKLFEPMIKYSWFSSGLSDDKPLFENVRDACFTFEPKESVNCSNEMCKNTRFIKCAHENCRQNLCFACFFYDYHYHYETD